MAPVPGAVNLMSRLRGAFTPGVILEASAFVCEDPYKTQRALEGIVPAMVLALLHRFHGVALLALVVNRLRPGDASVILGDQEPRMAEWIASEAGIGQESAASLLTLAAPRVIDALRRLQMERNLGGAALETVLQAHRPRLGRMLPGGLAEKVENWL